MTKEKNHKILDTIYVQIILQSEHKMGIGTVWNFCTC